MSSEINYVENKKHRAYSDAMRKYSFMQELPMTNEPLECVFLLGRLNEAITTMGQLQDDYYTHYIWNSSTEQDKLLEENGFSEEWFSEVEEKLILLRSLLMGENYDWNEVYDNLYKVALGHEVYWHEFYKERVQKLEYELRKKDRV